MTAVNRKIVLDVNKCMGCLSCELACAAAHSGSKNLADAIAEQPRQKARVHVESAGGKSVPMQCRHCEEAPCTMVCPKGAIKRTSPDGPVLLDAELCTGCKFCMFACPFGVIEVPNEGKALIKCDLCMERTESGEPLACVEACPTDALAFLELDDKLRERRRKFTEKVAADSARGDTQTTDTGKKMASCEHCGRDFAPAKQLKLIRAKLPEHITLAKDCPQCRRSRAAGLLAEMSAKSGKKRRVTSVDENK